MGVGLNSYDWQNLAQDYVNSKTYNKNYYANSPSYSAAAPSQVTPAVSYQGNYCTDGEDDGKIGILSATGNIIEGAGKAVINGVKGMFTDKNGKFSLLKTAGTVALGAACIAFPAVGLAMCTVGVVSGGTKLVKGVSNALTATTDAQAKDAWEAVGDGALTTAVSVAGAKASMGAIKTSAGATSELAKLSENASLFERIGALGKDAIASTKNTFKNLTEGIKIFRLDSADKKLGMKNSQNAANMSDVAESYAQRETIRTQARTLRENKSASKIANALEDGVEFLKNTKSKISVKSAKSAVGDYLKSIPEKIKGIDIKSIKAKITKSPKARYTDLKATLSPKAEAVVNFMRNTDPEKYTTTDLVKTFGYDAVIEALEVFASYRLLDESV